MPIKTPEFLRAVLPSDGVYCGFILPSKTHVWSDSPEQLADVLLRADAQGHTVYHACASFRARGKRLKSNVAFLRSFWLDIDCGDGKPYATPLAAYEALELFRAATGLPVPIIVGSGNGLHLYWPLDEDLQLPRWLPMAEGLKKLCRTHGFLAGPERTADAASLLRPVGAHHRKSAAREVVCEQLVDPYSLDSFQCLGSIVVPPVAVPANVQPRSVSTRAPLASAAMHVADYAPSDGNQVADQCAQLGRMRNLRGVLSEPEWKACLNTLAFVENGRGHAHEWSVGDERYSPAETDSKFTRGQTLSGPTSCAFFGELNSTCDGCVHRGTIISPVELGRGRPRAAPEQVAAGVKFAEAKDTNLKGIGDFDYQAGALVYAMEGKGGQVTLVRVTAYPVFVQSVTRGEARDADQYSVTLRHRPPHEGWQDVVVPLKTLFGSAGIAEVIGRGIVVHEGDLFRKFVRESIDLFHAGRRTQVQYEQFGWKDDESAFLVGRRLYSPAAVTDVDGSPEVVKRGKDLVPKGDLAAWTDAADQLFMQGVEPQGFALLCAFAAPLMRFNAHDEGGAIVSLQSAKSGQGKSTALTAAASVWGQKRGLEMTHQDTKVSKGLMLGVMGSLPVIFDELNNRDPESVAEFVQIFTTGRDKQRGGMDGGLVRQGNAWQTILLTGANISLIDTLKAARGRDALSTRVMEFSVDLPKTLAHWNGDVLKDQLAANAGLAGEAYMKSLVQPEILAYVKTALPKLRNDLIRKCGFQSQHRFWVRTLASVSVASVIVKHLGLLSFSPDRIIDWAVGVLTERGRFAAGELYEGSQMLTRFLSAHIASTMVMPRAWKQGERDVPPVKEPVRDLVVRYELDTGRVIIDERELRKWMTTQGVSWEDLLLELERKGLMAARNRPMTLGAGTVYARGQTPCLVINGSNPAMSGLLQTVVGDVKEQRA